MVRSRYNSTFKNLSTNMRNSENIVNASRCMGFKSVGVPKIITPSKNIQGPVNYYYLNSYSVSRDLLIVAAINKYFSTKESLVILKNGSKSIHELQTCLVSLLPHVREKIVCLPKYVDGNISHIMEKVERFLKNPIGILITDPENFHGAQARNTIISHSNNQPIKIIRNIILRTISFTFQVIDDEDNVKPDLGLMQDTNLHQYIHNVKPVCEELQSYSIGCYGLLASAVVNNFFKLYSKHNITIITPYNIASQVFERLCYHFMDKLECLFIKITEDKKVLKEFKSLEEKIMDKQGVIVVVDVHNRNLIGSIDYLNNAEDIIIISTKDPNEIENSEYDIACRNLILRASLKSVVIIHRGNLSEYDMFITLKKKENLQELVKDLISVPMIYYYANVHGLEDAVISLAVLNLYSNLKNNIVFIIKKGEGEKMLKYLKFYCNDEFVCCDFKNQFNAEVVAIKNPNMRLSDENIFSQVKMIIVFESLDFSAINFIIDIGYKSCLIIDNLIIDTYGAYSYIFDVKIL